MAESLNRITHTEFYEVGGSRATKLIVVLYGYRTPKRGRLKGLIAAIREDLPEADVLVPELETARLFSIKPAAAIAGEVIENIQQRWQDHGGYTEIILVGHSSGGALARKVVLGAWGQGSRVPFEAMGSFDRFQERREWAEKITRLVLIAGISSGWQASGRERWKEWLMLNLFGLLGHFLMLGVQPTFFDFRRGAPFIANTRLQMVDHFREQQAGRRPRSMITVQMLGSSDGIVAPNESLDFNADNELNRQLFVLEVPLSDHLSILDISTADANNMANQTRRNLLRTALYGNLNGEGSGATNAKRLPEVASSWHHLDDHMPHCAEPAVEDVVFVIHGIRDDGHWTKKIAARVKKAAKKPHTWKSVTPTYGYFAMLPFALPWIRRQKVEWLMHEYCEAAARYPNANFHYIGHSNGTYLGAAAMRDYTGCWFKRVVFAGSVVHPAYDWAERAKDSGVAAVVNYVATRDWVVAMAPNALRRFRAFDLGGAGHLGFGPQTPSFVTNLSYVKGGHGAAIAEQRWDEIAQFIVDGNVPPTTIAPASDFQSAQGAAIRSFAKVSPFIAVIAIALVLGVLIEMIAAAAGVQGPVWFTSTMSIFTNLPGLSWVTDHLGEWTKDISTWWSSCTQAIKLIGLAVYGSLLRFITTRF